MKPSTLLQGNVRFQRWFQEDRETFARLVARQEPRAFYIGCSDSRVVPELLTASSPGDLFVVRNVANLVPRFEHADASVGAALEYAVGHLHVAHVIVCGHYGCGGVKAVVDGLDHVQTLPSLHEWLGPVGPAVDRARAAGLEGDALWRRAVEESVLSQLENLVTFPSLAAAHAAGDLALHGWIYDLFTLALEAFDPQTGRFVPVDRLLAPTIRPPPPA